MVRLATAHLKGVIKLEPGVKVQLQGLTNSKELNGLVGHLLQFDAIKMRWGVELADGKKVSLKMGNLLPLDTHVAPASADAETGAPKPAPEPQNEQTLEKPAEQSAELLGEQQTEVSITQASDQVQNELHTEQQMNKPLEAISTQEVSDQRTAPLHEQVSNKKIDETSADTLEAVQRVSEPGVVYVENSEEDVSHATSMRGVADEEHCENKQLQECAVTSTGTGEESQSPPDLNAEEEWPELPSQGPKPVAPKRTGCWWDGGSAAKRFTEQLLANDETLKTVCLVPPKRFNDDDAKDICDALEVNTFCLELLASGHPLSHESLERIVHMLCTTKTLQKLSIGDSALGDQASFLFQGVSSNTSLTSFDLEHKGLTLEAFHALADALKSRHQTGKAPPLETLRLSRNTAVGGALPELSEAPAPEELLLCECTLTAKQAKTLGNWVIHGIEHLDLRDNSAFGGDGVEMLMEKLLPVKGGETPSVLRRLRLDGCAIGDDGLEAIAEAIRRGLPLEELYVERCEITVAGCEALAQALCGHRLRTLSVRANVIGDEGCTLLSRCAYKLDLSSTSLTGHVLATLGEQPLTALELFSNPSLGPSVGTWFTGLNSGHWQCLEYLDLSGCALKDEGFMCVMTTLLDRPSLMPALSFLCLGANDIKEDDEKSDLVEKVGTTRRGGLRTVWLNS